MKSIILNAATVVSIYIFVNPASAQDDSKDTWISSNQFFALSEIKEVSELSGSQDFTLEEILSHGIKISGDPTPHASFEGSTIPGFVPNSVILQIEPQATRKEIEEYFFENNMKPLEVYENIGQVKVEYDFSEIFEEDSDPLTPSLTESEKILEVLKTVEGLKKDGIVSGATPDSFITKYSSREFYGTLNVEVPSIFEFSDINRNEEQEDWGLDDIEVDAIWNLNVDRGVIVGVLDTGFADHEDLTFLVTENDNAPTSDHGNHVAGIMCAKHNGRGVKGVLKRCFIAHRSGSFRPISKDVDPVLHFYTRFSHISATLNEFVPDTEGPVVFNISLGYNWRRNFQINPDDPDSSGYRALVQSQGELLRRVYQIAEERGKAIFSAAGNDSHGLETPRSSKFASPFNWAAIDLRESGQSNNGVVVEAHDQNGSRASFSNVGGTISCPGVDILSAIAMDENRQIQNNLYGKMSGTSMASPYCAAAYALMYTAFPQKEPSEIIECMTSSRTATDIGTPRLKLSQAVAACRN